MGTLVALMPAALVFAVGGFALALGAIVTAASGCTAALVPPAVAVAAGGLAL